VRPIRTKGHRGESTKTGDGERQKDSSSVAIPRIHGQAQVEEGREEEGILLRAKGAPREEVISAA